jgi:hypothetical protein
MITRQLSLDDFLVAYRAILQELVAMAAEVPALWAGALSENPFAPPVELRGMPGEQDWRRRFEELMAAAAGLRARAAVPALTVLYEVLAQAGVRRIWVGPGSTGAGGRGQQQRKR